MSEKDLEKAVIKYIRWVGGYCQKVQCGLIKQVYNDKIRWIHLADKGTPDILACIKGSFLGIEVKKDEKEVERWNKQTTEHAQQQSYQQQLIRHAKGMTMVVGSLKQLEEDLKELGLIDT